MLWDEEDSDWNEEEEHDSFSSLNSKLNARSTVTPNPLVIRGHRKEVGQVMKETGEHPSVSPES